MMYKFEIILMIEFFFFGVVRTKTLPNANEIAAEADMNVIIEFIFDFEQSGQKYKSFMNQNSITFPQTFIDYYANIGTLGQSQFMSQLSTNFPFTEFKSIATNFPWFDEFLSSASVTEFYLPEQFTTSDELITSIQSAYYKGLTETTIIGGSVSSSFSTASRISPPASTTSKTTLSTHSNESLSTLETSTSAAGADSANCYSLLSVPVIYLFFLI